MGFAADVELQRSMGVGGAPEGPISPTGSLAPLQSTGISTDVRGMVGLILEDGVGCGFDVEIG